MTYVSIEKLSEFPIWVNWKYVNRGNSLSKIPIDPNTGNKADVSDLKTWSYRNHAEQNVSIIQYGVNGVGIVFTDLTPYLGKDKDEKEFVLCGIDIDFHHANNQYADEIIEMFSGTYIEKSPSGNGYHIIFLAEKNSLPNEWDKRYYKKNPHIEIECYVAGFTNRYFTFTNAPINNMLNVSDMTDKLSIFLEKYMRKELYNGLDKKTAHGKIKPEIAYPSQNIDAALLDGEVTQANADISHLCVNDVETILNKARNGKNGELFSALYDKGDLSGYNGDQSAADLALCRMLAFWFGKDETTIDEAFRRSALYRDKWDRNDYRVATISSAINSVSGTYSTNMKQNVPKSKQEGEPEKPKLFLTFEEFKKYCEKHGYSFKWDSISHKIVYEGFPKEFGVLFLSDTSITLMKDELKLLGYTGVTRDSLEHFVTALASTNEYNAVLDKIRSAKWDGKDRIKQIFDMWEISDGDGISRMLIIKWLKQCVALLMNDNIDNPFGGEIVLVFVGGQGASKTRFFEHLSMIKKYFGEGRAVNPDNKDSIIQATSVWICELGEIGSTMKKDLDKVKAFMTLPSDEYRAPYGRTYIRYPRITSFCGTVNDEQFLLDQTGNRRWATIKLRDDLHIDVDKQIKTFDSEQLWAQVYQLIQTDLASGKTIANCFRLTNEENRLLNQRNKEYTKPMKGELEVIDVLESIINNDNENYVLDNCIMSATEFIETHKDILGKYSSNQIAQVLKKIGYENKLYKINGKVKRGYCLPCFYPKQNTENV